MSTQLTNSPNDYTAELLGQVENLHFRLLSAEILLSDLTFRVSQLLSDGELTGDTETAHIVANALKFLREGSK